MEVWCNAATYLESVLRTFPKGVKLNLIQPLIFSNLPFHVNLHQEPVKPIIDIQNTHGSLTQSILAILKSHWAVVGNDTHGLHWHDYWMVAKVRSWNGVLILSYMTLLQIWSCPLCCQVIMAWGELTFYALALIYVMTL